MSIQEKRIIIDAAIEAATPYGKQRDMTHATPDLIVCSRLRERIREMQLVEQRLTQMISSECSR